MLGVERHNGFLPILGITNRIFVRRGLPLRFCVCTLSTFTSKQFLNGPLHVTLSGQAIDLEGISIVASRTVHALFRHQRLQNHLVRLKNNARALRNMSWHDL